MKRIGKNHSLLAPRDIFFANNVPNISIRNCIFQGNAEDIYFFCRGGVEPKKVSQPTSTLVYSYETIFSTEIDD